MRALHLCLGLGFFAAGCQQTETGPFVLTVSGGLEGAPLAGAEVSKVELRVRSLAGEEKAVATATRAAGGLDLPDAARSGQGSLAVAGLSATGAVVAYGRTIPMDLGGLVDATSSLRVMAQPVGTAARILTLPHAVHAPRCGLVGVRFLVIGDASSTALQVVDLLNWTSSDESSALPFAPETLATAGAYVLALSAKGEVALVDLEAGTTTTPAAPTGATFAEVVGGKVVVGDDGAAWIVGAGRASGATDLVLRLGTDGTLAARRLGTARTGAAVAWVPSRGVVVAYGTPVGPLEVLSPTATVAAPLPFPAEAAVGGVLAPWDSARVLRVDDEGRGTFLDLGCGSGCAPTVAFDAGKGVGAQALGLEGGGVVALRAGTVQLLEGAAPRSLGSAATAGCAVALPTGVVAIAIEGDAVLRTVLGSRK